MRRALAIYLLFLIPPTHVLAQAKVGESTAYGSAKEGARIVKALRDFVDAWNKHDAKAFSMVFADDADFTNGLGMSAQGRVEVEKFHAPLFATRFKETNQRLDQIRIRFIKPDVAAVDAHWEMTGAIGSNGQPIPVRKGLLNCVMTKEGDKWVITVMHNMDLPTS